MSKYLPTYKWWAATATTVGTIVIMFWTAGGIDTDDKKIVLVGLVVQRVVAYITSNEKGLQVTPNIYSHAKNLYRGKGPVDPSV